MAHTVAGAIQHRAALAVRGHRLTRVFIGQSSIVTVRKKVGVRRIRRAKDIRASLECRQMRPFLRVAVLAGLRVGAARHLHLATPNPPWRRADQKTVRKTIFTTQGQVKHMTRMIKEAIPIRQQRSVASAAL